MQPNNLPPTSSRKRFHRAGAWLARVWQKLWPEVIVGDLFFALALGVGLYVLSDRSDDRRAEEAGRIEGILEEIRAGQAERLENVRFVRDVAARTGPMPFHGLDLEGMNLGGLSLGCRDEILFEQCILRADFAGANLAGADMSLMDLTGADFRNADLSGTNLRESDLSGAIMLARGLDSELLDGICYSATTIWPDDVVLPPMEDASGPICNPGL